ncbi:unnamed protein product [Tilletia laevis]|uniref:CCHC-type domain-containing protein n=1 Tax=Tilletia laevis TaxID=157183 RepID=A0A9N8LMF4_9BASI|nr:unnamed protein product [Tilletia caries]CAD6923831.1 unnamed protein product [Tilletia laevis]CAD6956938.1 unnamed protein product [Tilletia laevis]
MLITAGDSKSPILKGLSPKAVVAKARAAILTHKSKEGWSRLDDHPIEHIVRAARSLPSGDWILSIGTVGWANHLSMRRKDWISALDPSARLKDANFELAVHLMPREFDPENMDHMQEFWDQNPHSFQSSGFKWAGGQNGKRHGTLLISFRRAADANAILKASVVWDHRLLETRRSVRRPNQCNRCQGFGHVAQGCTKPQTCGKCAGLHPASSCSCPVELRAIRCQTSHECAHLTFKCANCDGHHTAATRSCPARDRAYQAAREEELAKGDMFPVTDTFEALSSSGLDSDFYIGAQNQQYLSDDDESSVDSSSSSVQKMAVAERSEPRSPPIAGPSRRRSASFSITHTTQGQAAQAMDNQPESRKARHTLGTGVHLMSEHSDDASSVSSIDTVCPKV